MHIYLRGLIRGSVGNWTAKQISDHERSGRNPALRLITEGETVQLRDRQLGSFSGAVDDFVLCRGDSTPSYNLVVVIDDAEMGITEVVRGMICFRLLRARSICRRCWEYHLLSTHMSLLF